jgi:hypothetical protein
VASAAIDSTHRLLAALVDRDLGGAEGLFTPSACVWWSQRGGGLASVEGAEALARALVSLLDTAPPTRLSIVSTVGSNTITSAYVDEKIAWTLELHLDHDGISGAFLRGAFLPLQ